VGAGPLLIFLVVSAIDLALAKHFTETGKAIVSNALGGIWQWMVLLLFLIAIAIAISPVGRLRLGGEDAKPSLKFFDWCAVLICTLLAGGGVFWSAAEPLFHFQTPSPTFEGVTGGNCRGGRPSASRELPALGLFGLGVSGNHHDDYLFNFGTTRRATPASHPAGQYPPETTR
jgi:hypothetical protein